MRQEEKVCAAELDMGGERSEGKIQIYYFLTETECMTDGVEGETVFGVETRLYVGGNETGRCVVNDLSSTKEKIVAFIEKLARNSVTPVALRDVVEDFIADG